MFNNIYASFPLVFRETIEKTLFKDEFGDIPFEKLNKSLLPIFDEVADEEGIEKEVLIKVKVEEEEDENSGNSLIFNENTLDANTIDNYFFPIKSFTTIKDKMDEEAK